jgi:hypothetical protein
MRQLNLPPDAHRPDEEGHSNEPARPGALPALTGMSYQTPKSAPPMQVSEHHAQANVAPSPEQRLAKRKAALARMRELWNNSQARKNRIAGEDGVAFQKRMRAEW